MFSLTQVAISAGVGLVLSYVVVALYARWTRTQFSIVDRVLVSVTLGISILLWREAGNTAFLNDDPMPLVSPNDVLAPLLTYVCLGLFVAFRPSVNGPHWPRLRALLTLLSLVVNIATI